MLSRHGTGANIGAGMNFRLIATEQRKSASGTKYDHTIWMGEFDGLLYEEEALAFAKDKLGPGCKICSEELPTTLH